MTSVNLEKTLSFFKIQHGLPFENLTEYYLQKIIFYMFFLYPERYYTNKHKIKQIIELAKTL